MDRWKKLWPNERRFGHFREVLEISENFWTGGSIFGQVRQLWPSERSSGQVKENLER